MENTNINIWYTRVNMFLNGLENTSFNPNVALYLTLLEGIENIFDDCTYEIHEQTENWFTLSKNHVSNIETTMTRLLIETIIHTSDVAEIMSKDIMSIYAFYQMIYKEPLKSFTDEQITDLRNHLFNVMYHLENKRDALDDDITEYAKFEMAIDCVKTLKSILSMYKGAIHFIHTKL